MNKWNYGNHGSFAEIEVNTAWMGSNFARDICMKWFGWDEDDLDDYCGLDTKGRHRGELLWVQVKKGGWYNGIISKGMKSVVVIVDEQIVAEGWRDERCHQKMTEYIKSNVWGFQHSQSNSVGMSDECIINPDWDNPLA